MSYFDPVNPKQNFPELEHEIISFWEEHDTFRKSIEARSEENAYVYFDGPPFATGLPHYGHILAGTIKDVIPRFFTMRGKRISRRFGWDCHGVPVEFQVEKENKIGGKPEIEKMGVGAYNDLCRNIVMRCSNDWEKTVTRMGRWVDFKNDYKTMGADYMESVWWVFNSLWKKGLIYEGEKVVSYSPKLGSPLSNFEAGLNYKDIDDPAVTVKFKLVEGGKIQNEEFKMKTVETEYEWRRYHEIRKKEIFDVYHPEIPYNFNNPNETNPKNHPKVFISHGEIVGVVRLDEMGDDTLAFRLLAFDKQYRRKGFGTKAITLIEDFALEKKCTKIVLNSEKETTDFYEKNGFMKDFWKGDFGNLIPMGRNIIPTYILAWTTTPWTLPANVALGFGRDTEYVKCRDRSRPVPTENYILAKEALPRFTKELGEEPEILETFTGKQFVERMNGKQYAPLFPYFNDSTEKRFEIVHDDGDYVTTEEGTGIVHFAPMFGAEDYELCKKFGISGVDPIDENGYFNHKIPEMNGLYFRKDPEIPESLEKNANTFVIETLKTSGLLFKREQIRHSYPHCWRTDCALMYRGIKTWFVSVEKIKEKMVQNNSTVHWVPNAVGHKRFANWLANAKDWAISRNRYWGAPLPVWKCDDCDSVECIGSVKELQDKGSKKNIFVMRHGEGDHNVSGIINCDPTKPTHLTEKGRAQARETGQKLKSENIDLIFASPFPRTRQTAEEAAGSLGYAKEDIIYDDRLKEINVGTFEGKPLTEFRKFFKTPHERYYTAPHGGETEQDVFDRVSTFLLEVQQKHPDKNILIVTHGDPARNIRKFFTHETPDILFGMQGGTVKILAPAQYESFSFTARPHNENGDIDLHRPYIDDVTLSCDQCQTPMKRIPEVLDCWFESGSMPYGQSHYPFENKEYFENNFPANFIAEGLDQTRGWFYTLMVLSTALFEKPTYQNVIVNGIVLAEDGQKMSKSKKNYPDPHEVFEKLGVDAVRFTLMNSPVVKGDDLRFSESAVLNNLKNVFLPLWNAYSFFVTYANIDEWKPVGDDLRVVPNAEFKMNNKEKISPNPSLKKRGTSPFEKGGFEGDLKNSESNGKHTGLPLQPQSKLDLWILTELRELIKTVTEKMENYEIFEAVRKISFFLERLTNGYIRRCRRRFWKSGMGDDKQEAFQTLHTVLTTFCQVLAPIAPFITEHIYKNLTKAESVHLTDFPDFEDFPDDPALRQEFDVVETIISLGLSLRSEKKIKVRQPLQEVEIFLPKKFPQEILSANKDIILKELNVKDLKVIDSAENLAKKIIKPNARMLGPKFGKNMQQIIQQAKSGEFKEKDGGVQVGEFFLEEGTYDVAFLGKEGFDVASEIGIVIALNTEITDALKEEGMVRELIRFIQEARKEADFDVSDRIDLCVDGDAPMLSVFEKFQEEIAGEVLANTVKFGERGSGFEKEVKVEKEKVVLWIRK